MQAVWKWLAVAVAGRSPRRTLRRALCMALALAVFLGVLARPVIVRGHSMAPTLRDGSWRIATRWWCDAQRRPGRGDVVVIRRVGGRMYYLKRVLGLPGETVHFESGRLWINGHPIPEAYRSIPSDWTLAPVRLGPEEFFVAGDNRGMPAAEHAAGRVERRFLAGKIWP